MATNDLNLCQYIGHLGRDPETRHTASGKAVCNFSIAVNSTRGGEAHTEWINLIAWERQAEICQQYLTKGSKVYVSGRSQTRKWQNKEGVEQKTTELILERMQMLGGNPATGERTESQAYPNKQEQMEPQSASPAPGGGFGDEIPF